MPNTTSAQRPGETPSGGSPGRKAAVALAIGVVVGAGAGYGAGTLPTPKDDVRGYDEGYAAGLQEARDRLAESGLIVEGPEETMSLSGTVASTSEGQFTLTADPLSTNPLDEDRGLTERTILIGDATTIVIQVPRSPEEIEALFEQFDPASEEAPPEPFRYEDVAAGRLEEGMQVLVEADHDISGEASFTAVRIVIPEQPGTLQEDEEIADSPSSPPEPPVEEDEDQPGNDEEPAPPAPPAP